MPGPHLMMDLPLPDLEATRALARALAPHLAAGDVVALAGGLGAGKTTFARFLIEALCARHGAPAPPEVPSPTYTLVQTYETGGPPVWHFDLYRLERPEDAEELAIEEAFAAAVAVIEWPERLGPALPGDRLGVTLTRVPGTRVPGTARVARIEGRGGRGRALEAALTEALGAGAA